MLTLSLVIPLCGYFILMFMNSPENKLFPWLVTSIFLTIGSIISLIDMLNALSWQSYQNINLFSFLNFGSFKELFSLKFDSLSCFIAFIIYILSLFIVLFCLPYMRYKENMSELLRDILMLDFTMLLLISADNLLLLFFAYELQSIGIYIALNFNKKRHKSNQSAFTALLMNLGADSLICGTAVIVFMEGSTELQRIGMVLIILAAVIKGGQFGFGLWVAGTMEGPSPIAALLNGLAIPLGAIVLLLTFLPLSESNFFTSAVIAIGTLGAIGGAVSACLQYEVKRILAYSTISQTGLMFIAIGQGSVYPVLLLFALHGASKILLFLSYAEVIRAMSGEHDIRHFGGIGRTLKFSCFASIAGSIGIILTTASAISVLSDFVLLSIGIITSFLTGIYLFRPLFSIFFGKLKGEEALLARLTRESLLSITAITGLLLSTLFACFYFFKTEETETSNYLLLVSLIGVMTVFYSFKKALSLRDYIEFSLPRTYLFLRKGFGSETFYYQFVPSAINIVSQEIISVPYKYNQWLRKSMVKIISAIPLLKIIKNSHNITINIFITVTGVILMLAFTLIIRGYK